MNSALALLTFLLLAMADVENDTGDPLRTNGDCVGTLQLRPIFVAEVNRILKEDKYTLDDRTSRAKSMQMARIWMTYYLQRHPEWSLNDAVLAFKCGTTGMKDATAEDRDHAQRVVNLVGEYMRHDYERGKRRLEELDSD